MDVPRLEDHGLSPAIVEEIRAREKRQFGLFVRLTGACSGVLWLLFTVFVYSHSFRQAPLLGLALLPSSPSSAPSSGRCRSPSSAGRPPDHSGRWMIRRLLLEQ